MGAACSILLDGCTAVDVGGGWRDHAMQVPWDAPTTVCMMSAVKGITAVYFNTVIDRALVDPDARGPSTGATAKRRRVQARKPPRFPQIFRKSLFAVRSSF
jgi:hypothetical protein